MGALSIFSARVPGDDPQCTHRVRETRAPALLSSPPTKRPSARFVCTRARTTARLGYT